MRGTGRGCFWAMSALTVVASAGSRWIRLQEMRATPAADPVRQLEAERMVKEQRAQDELRSRLERFPQARCQSCAAVHDVNAPLLGELRCPDCNSAYLEAVIPEFKPYEKEHWCPKCDAKFIHRFESWDDEEANIYCMICGTEAYPTDNIPPRYLMSPIERFIDDPWPAVKSAGYAVAIAIIVWFLAAHPEQARKLVPFYGWFEQRTAAEQQAALERRCRAIHRPQKGIPDLLQDSQFLALSEQEKLQVLREASVDFCMLDYNEQLVRMRKWGIRF
jgi:uncharacterized protein YbaR (Trm112 family)